MKGTILRIVIGTVLVSLLAGLVVAILGLVQGWQAAQFGDGFFWAGVILILFGVVSFQGYSQRTVDWPPVRVDPAGRARLWAVDVFRGKILMAIFGISGLLLFGLSVLVARLF